jgi:hypothetical protein
MDKVDDYRKLVFDLIERHAGQSPSHGNIESLPLYDTANDNYLLMDVGWDNTGRVHSIVLHIRLRSGKILIEWDGTENGVAAGLVEAGVPKEDIVLAFYRPERRSFTEFAA